MPSAINIRAAEALFPLLSIFHELDGAVLASVQEVRVDDSLTRIVLELDARFLVIQVEAEADTISLSIHSASKEGKVVSKHQPWSNFLGRPIGWGWVTINQQGYLDGVLLSFSGVVPEILITVLASRLQVMGIDKC